MSWILYFRTLNELSWVAPRVHFVGVARLRSCHGTASSVGHRRSPALYAFIISLPVSTRRGMVHRFGGRKSKWLRIVFVLCFALIFGVTEIVPRPPPALRSKCFVLDFGLPAIAAPQRFVPGEGNLILWGIFSTNTLFWGIPQNIWWDHSLALRPPQSTPAQEMRAKSTVFWWGQKAQLSCM